MMRPRKYDNKTVSEYARDRVNKKLFGYKIRQPHDSEKEFFKENPDTHGYAADDNSIVLNPYSSLSKKELSLVAINEALRLKIREDDFDPQFDITEEQIKYFKGTPYENNKMAMRQTILARIHTGDPSAKSTKEQKEVLKKYLLNKK